MGEVPLYTSPAREKQVTAWSRLPSLLEGGRGGGWRGGVPTSFTFSTPTASSDARYMKRHIKMALTRGTVTSKMCKAVRVSGCARGSAGAGCLVVKYQSTSKGVYFLIADVTV